MDRGLCRSLIRVERAVGKLATGPSNPVAQDGTVLRERASAVSGTRIPGLEFWGSRYGTGWQKPETRNSQL